MQKVKLREYCELYQRPELLEEWDAERNGDLTPDTVYPNSRVRVFWCCEQGHSWQASLGSRTNNRSGCPVCAGKAVEAGENDFGTLYPELSKQWHPTKNGALDPSMVRPGTHRKVWWQCDKGHEWQAMIKSRVDGCGCPVCAGRTVLKGETDLLTLRPELAAEWDPTKNECLRASDVRPGSNRKAWWRCEKGHSWQASISSRVKGYGCPVCAGKNIVSGENDFAFLRPELASQWHPKKNTGLEPSMVAEQSNRSVWWKDELGHEWSATVASRVRGSGCPYCANKKLKVGFNDLKTRFPEIAKEWDTARNGIAPNKVFPTNSKAWWKCSEGHSYQAAISVRAFQNTGCPYCAGRKVMPGYNDLASQEPKIAAQWHPILNGDRTPEMFTCGSNQKVWWQCEDGHSWQAPISRRCCNHSGCPICSGNVSKKKLEKYDALLKEARAEQSQQQRVEDSYGSVIRHTDSASV